MRIGAGPSRTEALALARGAARYLMGRQIVAPGDPRDGLVAAAQEPIATSSTQPAW